MKNFPRRTCVVLGLCVAITLGAIGTALAADADHVEQLLRTNTCPLCDLSDAALGGKPLTGADLSGANLLNAVLYGANLQGANLAGAILSGADLKMADLTGAVEAALADAETDERTICPNGFNGPCQ